jgi:glycosyltransferase involved in cell wall biosynthesis
VIKAMARAVGTQTVVCFSHLRWDFVYQRPQHLLSRAAIKRTVIFFEEPKREAGAKPHLSVREDKSGVFVATPVLPVLPQEDDTEHQRKMVDLLFAGLKEEDTILWYYTPMALGFTRQLQSRVCIYDNMDELSAFKGASPSLLSLENELLERADLVFTGGESLYRAKRHRHQNIHPFPSSIDADHFRKARKVRSDPLDQRDLPRPRFGFFGVIDERLDIALLADLADLRPDWQFVMIGPVVKISPESLPRRPNIAWLGMKAYQDLPAYLSTWDGGIMPFAQNEATRFISPTKTPEFLAAGVPVISTPIQDVVDPYGEAGLVEIASAARDFIQSAERILQMSRTEWVRRVDRHLQGCSWDLTWAKMERLISAASTHHKPGHNRPVNLHV